MRKELENLRFLFSHKLRDPDQIFSVRSEEEYEHYLETEENKRDFDKDDLKHE